MNRVSAENGVCANIPIMTFWGCVSRRALTSTRAGGMFSTSAMHHGSVTTRFAMILYFPWPGMSHWLGRRSGNLKNSEKATG
ncbi:hypothetical protein I7I53_11590 [Histoplasma capsulatum var. duboisii H88]|uniref:Uncharacterized protein n=1 Tax=Ajellomyces capsulatus (strain H88) TaxID=544711 RepID=A0A8A1LUF4_AJEC8|nr:hypothetical protein I7I53_11590 [Histoplasma capsulatum var. duboisii H88]